MCNILICSKIYKIIFLHKYHDMCTHFLSQLKINVFEKLWDTTIYIISHNNLRDAINHYMIQYTSKKFNHKCHTILAINTY